MGNISKRLKVYIASPYTNDWMPNAVRRQLEAKNILLDYGFVPFAPLENHFNEIYKHRPEREWLEWELEWLEVCDIFIRLRPSYENGKEILSSGSDIEEAHAKKYGIPIFNFENIDELEDWVRDVDQEELWSFCKIKNRLKNE